MKIPSILYWKEKKFKLWNNIWRVLPSFWDPAHIHIPWYIHNFLHLYYHQCSILFQPHMKPNQMWNISLAQIVQCMTRNIISFWFYCILNPCSLLPLTFAQGFISISYSISSRGLLKLPFDDWSIASSNILPLLSGLFLFSTGMKVT